MCAGFEGASEGLGDEHGGPDPDAGHGGQDLVKRVGLHQGLDLRGDVTPMGVQGDELARQVREHHASGVGADQHLGLGVQGVDDRVRPGGVACAPEPGWMMHTDQGFQYQHPSWRNLIDDNGGVQSMSRKANCYDNALAETVNGLYKAELIHAHGPWTSVDWRNNKRIHEALDYATPQEIETEYYLTQPITTGT